MQDKSGFNGDRTIRSLLDSRTENGDGSFRVKSIFADDILLVLSSAIKKPDGMDQDDFDRIIIKLGHDSRTHSKTKNQEFRRLIQKRVSEWCRLPVIDFVVFFRINAINGLEGRSITINNSSISFLSNVKSRKICKFLYNQKSFLNSVNFDLHEKYSQSDACYVLARVRARDSHEALRETRYSLDVIRGLLNFFINKKIYRTFSSLYRERVINRIRIFPVATIHHANGSIQDSLFWYDPKFKGDFTPVDVRAEISGFDENFMKWVNILRKKTSMMEVARVSIRQYARALDESDMAYSFLNLWLILEYMTGQLNSNYDHLIERVSGIFLDYQKERETLRHLRFRRNLLVHDPSADETSHIITYQCKYYVECMIEFMIKTRINYKDHDDFLRFLDMPREKNELEARRRRINLALSFVQK